MVIPCRVCSHPPLTLRSLTPTPTLLIRLMPFNSYEFHLRQPVCTPQRYMCVSYVCVGGCMCADSPAHGPLFRREKHHTHRSRACSLAVPEASGCLFTPTTAPTGNSPHAPAIVHNFERSYPAFHPCRAWSRTARVRVDGFGKTKNAFRSRFFPAADVCAERQTEKRVR